MNTKTISFSKSKFSEIASQFYPKLKTKGKINGINISTIFINECDILTKKDFSKKTTKGVRNGDVRNPRLRTLINKLLTVKF